MFQLCNIGLELVETMKNYRQITLRFSKELSLKDPGLQSSSIFKFDIEVQMLRAIIRDSSILDDPYSQLPLKAIDDTTLHHDFVNY